MVYGNQKGFWSQISDSFNADVCSKFINNTRRRLGQKKQSKLMRAKYGNL